VKIEILLSVIYASFSQMFSTTTVLETALRNLCKTPLFVRFLCQAQILILEILDVFLWLKLSPSLNLNKNIYFSKVSLRLQSNWPYHPSDNVIQLGYWNTGITIFDSKWITSETFGPSQK
jgi:hypothetical protein